MRSFTMRNLWLPALVLISLMPIGPASAATTISDGTFNNAAWVAVQLTSLSVSGSSFTSAQDNTAGLLSPSRTTTHTYPNGSIFVGHRYQTTAYDPSTGAISSLSYAYDLNHRTNGFVGYSLLVFQNGTYYRAPENLIAGANSNWTNFTGQNLTASSFTRLEGPSKSDHPDFSCKGSRIEFGYVTRNHNGGTGIDVTTSSIDNWTVTLETSPCCAAITAPKISCDRGVIHYTFTVTNHSPTPVQYLFLSPSSGFTFTVSPSVVDLGSNPLSQGQSTSITVTIGNAPANTSICLDVILADGLGVACCKVTTCVDVPECPCLKRLSEEIECGPGGTYVYTVTIRNDTGTPIQQIFVIPTTPGVAVTPQSVPVTLPISGTTTLQFTISGASPGSSVCIRVAPVGAEPACCSTEICFKVPARNAC